MQPRFRLRHRLYLFVLPVIAAGFLSAGMLAYMESRTALTRGANRHLAFKAEQLRDYFYSEWEIIDSLGLSGLDEYRAASQESFRTYAYSLLRSSTELVVAFDGRGTPVLWAGDEKTLELHSDSLLSAAPGRIEQGWFDGDMAGSHRIGVAFTLEPFGWTVVISELYSVYFAQMRNIGYSQALILLITLLIVSVFISVFISYVVRPVEKLSHTIHNINISKDLTARADVGFYDEIGLLANRFNRMIASLQAKYTQLEMMSGMERKARKTAVEREEETLFLLARMSEFRDEGTGEHQKRIGEMSRFLSSLIGEEADKQEIMAYSAPLHDIGKIRIPDSILLKKGSLAPEEWEIMKRHAYFGYELLKDSSSIYLSAGAEIALTHHERWDGKGYPSGLAGEDIPVAGRIVSIVDVFDALSSDRPYKEAWEYSKSLEYIMEQREKAFDPRLVDLFIANFAVFCRIIERYADVD